MKNKRTKPIDVNETIIAKLKRELVEVQKQISATKKRLPAHSAKPPIMIELFELEEKYEEISERLQQLEKRAS